MASSVTATSILLLASLLVFQEVHCWGVSFKGYGIEVDVNGKRGLRARSLDETSVFALMDTDGNEQFEQDEWVDEHGDTAGFANLLALYDKNGDGAISESEFEEIPVSFNAE